MILSDKSKIEWCDASWNPVTGCTKVSEGCRNCYAEKFAERFRGKPGHYFENGFDITLRPDKMDQPLKWKRPRKIFVNSMSDLFHPDVPEPFIDRVFAVMAQTPEHIYQILTKRPERMRSYLMEGRASLVAYAMGEDFGNRRYTRRKINNVNTALFHLEQWPLPNVWLGTSVENQKAADERIPLLLQTPAAVRFLSMEPLLDSVNLKPLWETCPECGSWEIYYLRGGNCYCDDCGVDIDKAKIGIDWIIAGGESGPKARPMHPEDPRSIRDQCQTAGVPFFFKQWGTWFPLGQKSNGWDGSSGPGVRNDDFIGQPMYRIGKKKAGRLLDGREWNEFPEVQ